MRLFRAFIPCLVSVIAISFLQGCGSGNETSEVQRTASFNEAIMKSKAGYAASDTSKPQKKEKSASSSRK